MVEPNVKSARKLTTAGSAVTIISRKNWQRHTPKIGTKTNE